jgi:hypothetical protein
MYAPRLGLFQPYITRNREGLAASRYAILFYSDLLRGELPHETAAAGASARRPPRSSETAAAGAPATASSQAIEFFNFVVQNIFCPKKFHVCC